MKKIEQLLAEYRIRFRDTERIKEDGYPFKRWQMSTDLGEEEFTPYVYGDVIINRYGTVYGKGVWATADLKEAPDKWVVEKDKNHPMWSKFARETGWHIEGDCDLPFGFYGAGCRRGKITDFVGHQLLTLDQWAEFFLPKIDFLNGSIMYEKGRIMIMKGKEREYHALLWLAVGVLRYDQVCLGFDLRFRPASEKEKQALFDALAEEGKRWNPETLQIEDLIDFSILNDEDWFYVDYKKHGHNRSWLLKTVKVGSEYLFRKVAFDLTNMFLHKSDCFTANGLIGELIILRKATPKDLAPLFEEHSHLAPPKIGDWGVFYDDEERVKYSLARGLSVFGYIDKLTYIDYSRKKPFRREICWKHFHKIDPTKSLLEIIDQLKKEFNVE